MAPECTSASSPLSKPLEIYTNSQQQAAKGYLASDQSDPSSQQDHTTDVTLIGPEDALKLIASIPDSRGSDVVLDLSRGFSSLANTLRVSVPLVFRRRIASGQQDAWALLSGQIVEALTKARRVVVVDDASTRPCDCPFTSGVMVAVARHVLTQPELLFVCGGMKALSQHPAASSLHSSQHSLRLKLPNPPTMGFGKALEEKLLPTATISRVLPGLYVSGAAAACTESVLAEHGIQAVVNATTHVPNAFENDSAKHISYLRVAILDSWNQPIGDYFQAVAHFVQSHLDLGKPVLVHCEAGISRSVTLVVAYLMIKRSMCFDCAYSLVRAARPVACPNLEFIAALHALSKALQLQHDASCRLWAPPSPVSCGTAASPSSIPSRRTRSPFVGAEAPDVHTSTASRA